MQVAVFGGSFDPPHVGHVLLATYLGIVAPFDRVLVVPVFGHAFEKELSPFEHRLRMCQLAFERLAFVEVTPIEATLRRPNYTVHTLEAIQRAHPDWQLRLAMGADVLAESAQWYQFEAVIALAPPFVFARHGYPADDSSTYFIPAVSSTELRAQLRRRDEPGVREALTEVMPQAVIEYIEENRLYTDHD
jgi:nicotinate-nucleotide adenylyltransferase